jgi:hypothetical protein
MITKPFPMKKSASIKFLTLCVLSSSENNEDNADRWLQSDACELGFQHVTSTDNVILPLNKRQKWDVRMRVRKTNL